MRLTTSKSSSMRVLALSVILTLLTAACGSRLSDEERAQAIANTRAGGSAAPTAEEAGDGGSELTDGSTDVTTPAASGDTGGEAVSGADGDTGGAGPATGDTGGVAAACRPGSGSSIGVTPTEITVGNVSQLSGLVPEFGRPGINGAKAYFNMINSQGGVCGRTIKMVVADDRFQAATNRSETEKLSGQVLAFVGSTSVVDDGGASVIDAKGVADVSLATTRTRTKAANNYSPNPINPTPGAGNGLAGVLDYLKGTDGIKKPAIFYQEVATGVNQANEYKVDFEKAGIPVVATYPVAPIATNFNTQANDMKAKGIDFVITVAEVNAMANLAKAFESVGYFPKVPFYGAQVYGKRFLQLAGAAAENTKVGLIFAIPEEAPNNPAMANFNTWFARTAPGADVDFFALAGWVAADLFVTALTAAGPDPTQAKVLAELEKIKSFNAHGAVSDINPADKATPQCFQVVKVEGGKWVKVYPDRGFKC